MILNRQKIVGWVLIAVSAVYLAYFWRVRLMASGAPIAAKEWFNIITCVALLMIGTEAKAQMMKAEGRLPDAAVACIGGGSNAMGLFYPFLDDPEVALYGVEAAGLGIETGRHAASLAGGRPGVLHGNRTYLLQDDDGQIIEAHSISAGLDYPGIGPEHAWLHDMKRVNYVSATDMEALDAFQLCARQEGIIPALEPAHALAFTAKLAKQTPADKIILMNMCGRGDKDIFAVAEHLGVKL